MQTLMCSSCKVKEGRYFISFQKRRLCTECYQRYFERKLQKTVLKYNMIKFMQRPLVALSGGKDSIALLAGLRRAFPNLDLTAVHLNLGVPGYSDRAEEVSRKVAEEYGVPIMVVNVAEETGHTIPSLAKGRYKRKPCSICGTVKRHLLNRIAVENGFDSVVTGHNLDDTVEVLFEMYFRGDLASAIKLRPVLPGDGNRLAARIKPLIEMTDEEDLYYVDSLDMVYVAAQCPLVKGSRMLARKELLREIEAKIPGFRHTLLKSHFKRVIPLLEQVVQQPVLKSCSVCNFPTTSNVCSYCRAVARTSTALSRNEEVVLR